MHVALLCPGPSLPRTWPGRQADLVIAINRAGAAFPAQIWAALDLPLIVDHGGEVIGSPSLFTRGETYESLRRRGHPWALHPAWLTEDVPCPVQGWALYTATAAIVLAGRLGATRIDVYGADWTDAPDFDGVTVEGCRRTEERWAVERGIWGKLVEWLAGQSVEVIRHGAV